MSREERRAQIIKMYAEGMWAGEIAKTLGVHRATVYNNLNAAGVELRDDRSQMPGKARAPRCRRGLHQLLNEDGTDTENVWVDGQGKRYCYPCAQTSWALQSALESMERGTL